MCAVRRSLPSQATIGLQGSELVVLVGGGDKGSQRRDIARAKDLWRIWSDEKQRI